MQVWLLYRCRDDVHVLMCLITGMIIIVIIIMTSGVIMVTKLTPSSHHRELSQCCHAALYAGKCRFGCYIDVVMMCMC